MQTRATPRCRCSCRKCGPTEQPSTWCASLTWAYRPRASGWPRPACAHARIMVLWPAQTRKKYEVVVSECGEAIRQWRGNIKAYWRMAKALVLLGQYEPALEALKHGLDVEPGNEARGRGHRGRGGGQRQARRRCGRCSRRRRRASRRRRRSRCVCACECQCVVPVSVFVCVRACVCVCGLGTRRRPS